MKGIAFLLVGFIGGVLVTIAVGWNVMPGLMFQSHQSTMSFDQTVAAIESSAKDKGWLVPKIYNIQNSLQNAGHEGMTPLTVISMCQPDYAYEILQTPENRVVSAMMPCRVGVYTGHDGATYVASLNLGTMSQFFGGTVESVMGRVAMEEKEILDGIIMTE